MDPTLVRMTNWIVYHLSRGMDYTTILPLFEREFGAIPQAQYDAAFDAAALAEANAGNLTLANPRQLIRNVFRLPGSPFDTVEVRAVCEYDIVRTRGGQPYVAATRYMTISADFGYGQRVGEIVPTLEGICNQEAAGRYGGTNTSIEIIPGIYWPGLD